MLFAHLDKTNDHTVKVVGDLDFNTALALREEGLSFIMNANQSSLIFDLSGIRISNSAGVALLVEWLGCARENNKTLSYHSCPEKLLSVIALSNLTALLGFANEN